MRFAVVFSFVVALWPAWAGAVAADDAAASRPARWEHRNSPEAVEAEAKALGNALTGGDWKWRPELAQVLRLGKEQKYAEALAAFDRYFQDKFRYPEQYGLALRSYPDAAPDRSKVLAEADRLMQHTMTIDGKAVDIGEPGAVNWNYPFGLEEAVPADKEVAKPLAFPLEGFSPLVQAYLLTHGQTYLRRWADYLDDWSLNATYLQNMHPCFVPSGVQATTSYQLKGFAVQLGALAKALPADQYALPPSVLARVLQRLLSEQLLHVVYIRSNCHNWTPGAGWIEDALLYDEFKAAPFYFREGRRRGIEDNAVTQNLRDGTENQQCPWYNQNYMGVSRVFKLLQAREILPSYKEQTWVWQLRSDLSWRREVQEHLNEHANWLLHSRTPQNEYPIPVRGGDKRQALGMPGEWIADAAPQAYQTPENARLIAAIVNPASGLRPTFTDEWFPYAGYNYVREGWEKDSGYGMLFCSPKPGAYGAYRSRSNNNTFGLAAYGEDLLVDDNGASHYTYPTSPITVDGKMQFFHAGIYRVFNVSAHKTYLQSAWTEPANWRWHSSPRFSLMEGLYAGPYANPEDAPKTTDAEGKQTTSLNMPLACTLQGVTHQRLVHYLRRRGLWLVTDRMTSDKMHTYEQMWVFPLIGQAPAFTTDQIKVDPAAHRIYTDAPAEVNGKATGKVNVSLYQFATSQLKYSTSEHPVRPRPDGRVFGNGYKKVKTAWQGLGATQMITTIRARKPGSGGEDDLQTAKQLTGPDGVTGCEVKMPDGAVVQYLAAPSGDGDLTLGDLQMRGETLLLDGEAGLALGCKSISYKGKSLPVPAGDFEFTLQHDTLTEVTPIFRPIDPVQILPDHNVFVDKQEITLSSRTPGVEIHYTLDGADPTPQSPRYTGPFTITTDVTLKARAYRPGVTANPIQLSGTQATVASLAVFTKATPIDPVTANKAGPGLKYSYFEDDWKRLWLCLDELQPKNAGTAPAIFDPGTLPDDNPPVGSATTPRKKYYAVRYTGLLKVPSDGVYTIHAPREYVMPDTDAGYEMQLYLGNCVAPFGRRTRVIGVNPWYPSTRLHALSNWSVALKKGFHPFELIFIDYRTDAAKRLNLPGIRDYIWAGAVPDLRVSGPNLEKQPIPVDWFWHN